MIYLRLIVEFAAFYNERNGEDDRIGCGTVLVALEQDENDDYLTVSLIEHPHLKRVWMPKGFATELSPLEVLAEQAE